MTGSAVHSLGTTEATVAALAAALVLVEARRGNGDVRRLRAALGASRPARSAAAKRSAAWRGRLQGAVRGWAPVIAAGLGVAVLLGGPLGALAGAVTVLVSRAWLARRQRPSDGLAADAELDPAELPLCADLMAACLAAGASPAEAAGAVGRCLGGALGAELTRAQAELRLGGDPAECWDRFGRLPQARAMARCLARASTTGTAPVAEMARLAADYRAARARAALARARRAAVTATAPLGVCFLPAFLLVGVAPVVMGLAGAVLGGTVR